MDKPSYTKIIFTAMSKRNFFLREHIIKYVLEQGYTPTCAFMMYSYFLLDTVKREALISANNALLRKSDEVWIFGHISDGVREEIKLAESLNIPIKYYSVKESPICNFEEVTECDAKEESYE